MVLDRLRKCVRSGLSIIVATADTERVPSCCRGIAIKTNDEFETVTVYVPAATSHETMANVATTRRVAIVCAEPLSHETTQIKGVTRAVRLASQSEESFVRERRDAFAGVLASLGYPLHLATRITHWPAFAIDVSVEQVFDQTPGPNAGTALP
jgi:hypothetical protein